MDPVYGVTVRWPDGDEFFFLSPDGEAYLEVAKFPESLDGVAGELRQRMEGVPTEQGRGLPMRMMRRFFRQLESSGKTVTYHDPLNA
jgi:hypothetical protein